MRYEDSGNFTSEQRAICKKIKQLINDGKRKGLLFKFVNNKVKAYIEKEYFEIGELEDDRNDIIGD